MDDRTAEHSYDELVPPRYADLISFVRVIKGGGRGSLANTHREVLLDGDCVDFFLVVGKGFVEAYVVDVVVKALDMPLTEAVEKISNEGLAGKVSQWRVKNGR